MKKFDFIPTVILSIVTCGIYSLYVWYVANKNNNTIAEGMGMPKISSFIMCLLLGAITCGIYTIYWYYKFCDQQINILKAKGRQPVISDSPILTLILLFVPFLSWYILCENYNQGIDG